MSLLIPPLAAQAGTYTAPTPTDPSSVYSGGTLTRNGTASPYFYSDGAYHGSGVTLFQASSLQCAGTITTTWNWTPDNPNDLPPQNVIIVQTSSVSAGDGAGTGSASCADGLGGTFVPYDPAHPNEGGTAQSTKYTVVSGGLTVSVPCTPTANASDTNSSTTNVVSVSYSAQVYPITISLAGGIGPSYAKSLLIGQQLTATLNIGGLTPTSWYWGASGGLPFKSYTASNASATYTPLGYETANQLVCYFSQPTQTASVSCLVHLAVPTGASPSGGLDLTVTQPLIIEKPSAVLDVLIGNVTDLPTSTNPNYVQLQQFYRNPPPNDGSCEGITWFGTITTPASYVVSGNYGSWNWTQLISAGRQEKNNGIYWQFAVNTTTPPTVINGLTVLDGSYPYGGFWYPSDGTTDGNADSPGNSLDADNAIRAYDVLDSFNDYLMYQPPGAGSLPVPLKRSSWFWEFHATKDVSNAWSTSGENAQWGFNGDFPAFPTWTFYAPVGSLLYASP